MAGHKRRGARVIGGREAQAIAANLGRDTRATRQRRRLTQDELGRRVGLSQSEISLLELGRGAGTSMETWVAIGIALERPLAIGFSRDVVDPLLSDAGHLAAQELVMRLAAGSGRSAQFEVPTDRRNPSWSVDVGLLDRKQGVLILVEIWNRLDDLGAAVRSTDRKLAGVAGAAGRISACWVLVDTAANRAIINRYPALLRSRFPGSSAGWVRALADAGVPPAEPGLVWAQPGAGRLRALRLRGTGA